MMARITEDDLAAAKASRPVKFALVCSCGTNVVFNPPAQVHVSCPFCDKEWKMVPTAMFADDGTRAEVIATDYRNG